MSRKPFSARVGAIIDAAIEPFSPALAGKRRAQRDAIELLGMYNAAIKNRLYADWLPSNYAAESLINDVGLANARARHAYRNDGFARSVVGAFPRNIVSTGILPRANARNPLTKVSLDDFNRAINLLWKVWSETPEYCDQERMKTWLGIQYLCVNELPQVGESFVLLNYELRRDMVGLVLQVCEPEQLDTVKTMNASNGNDIKGGVEVNRYGAPVAYWFYTKEHPLSTYKPEASDRIPAERVIHLIRPDRVRQPRGITWLHAVLNDLRNLAMYDEYELISARFQAAISGFIEQPADSAGINPLSLFGTAGSATQDTKANDLIKLEPGVVPVLKPGWKITPFIPSRPGTTFGPYIKNKQGKIGAGVGLDYPSVSRDYSGNTYHGQKQGKGELEAEMDPVQEIVVQVLCRKVWRTFVDLAIQESRVDALGYADSLEWHEAYLEAFWRRPKKKALDPAKEAAAHKIELELGSETLADVVDDGDWQTKLAERSDVEEYGQSLDPPAELPWLHPAKGASPSEPKPRENQPEENDSAGEEEIE